MAQLDTIKIIQAAAVLLREHEGRISRLRLLKLLYIADRECLAETLHPVTYDKAVAMDHGPVLSKTYDLIEGEDIESPEWNKFITHIGPRDMALIADPGVGKLSRYEIDKLIDVSRRFWAEDDWALVDFTHQYPEWIQNQPARGAQNPISFDDRMSALGYGEAEKNRIIAEHKQDLEVERLLAGA